MGRGGDDLELEGSEGQLQFVALDVADLEGADVVAGMGRVTGVERLDDDRFMVLFDDRSSVMVNPAAGEFKSLEGDLEDEMLASGIYAALEKQIKDGDLSGEQSEVGAALLESLDLLRENPGSVADDLFEALKPELERAGLLAGNFEHEDSASQTEQTIDEVLRDIMDDDADRDERLQRIADKVDVRVRLEDQAREEMFSELADDFVDVEESMANAALTGDPTRGLLVNFADDGKPTRDPGRLATTPEQIQERLEAAERLGGETYQVLDDEGNPMADEDGNPVLSNTLIPELRIKMEPERDANGEIVRGPDGKPVVKSVGEFHMGDSQRAHLARLQTKINAGQRFFVFRGPPGTGKDTFVKQVAALKKMPQMDFTLGPGVDMQELVGGSGIGVVEFTETRARRDIDPETGLQRVDPDTGKELWVTDEITTPISVTQQKVGDLTDWIQEPSIITLQEPEGQQDDLVALHKAFGDDLFKAGEDRFIRVTSAEAGESKDEDGKPQKVRTYKVHPDCMIFITHNDRENQSEIPDATVDRASGQFTFDYGTVREESERLAATLTAHYSDDNPNKYIPPALRGRRFEAQEVMPFVSLWRRAQRLAQDGELEREMGARTLAMNAQTVLDRAASSNKGADNSWNYLLEEMDHLVPMHGKNAMERKAVLKGLFGTSYKDIIQEVVASIKEGKPVPAELAERIGRLEDRISGDTGG